MRPVNNSWPKSAIAENVKFCAQILTEMLSIRSYESFRVTTLDARSKALELEGLCNDVLRDRIPTLALDPCIAELIQSMEADVVLREKFPHLKAHIEVHAKGKALQASGVQLFANLMSHCANELLGNYKTAIEEKISELVKIKRKDDALKSLCNAYMSILINSGYSRQYLIETIEKKFLLNSIKKVESRTLPRFFKSFDDKDRTFDVYLFTPIDLSALLKTATITELASISQHKLPMSVRRQFSSFSFTSTQPYFSVVSKQRAKDKFSAFRLAYDQLLGIEAITGLSSRPVRFRIRPEGVVRNARNQVSEIARVELPLYRATTFVTPRLVREAGEAARKVFNDFTPESTERLVSALNISSIARKSGSPENQLITLWSSIEALLTDPPTKTARVVHYVDALAPAICLNYGRRYFNAIYEEFNVSYRRYLLAFFNKQPFAVTNNTRQNLLKLCFDPALSSLQSDLISPIDNPLLRYRLTKFMHNFGQSAAAFRSIEAHEERVRWQLFRIYRIRNSIVHSGSIPTFIRPLVMNLFEYYSAAVEPIIERARRVPHRESIDQIVSDIRFDFERLKAELRAEGAADLSLSRALSLFQA